MTSRLKFAALILAAVGALAWASPAQATTAVTSTATVKDSPDDGCPTPWARNTFTRTTTITQAGEGKYKVAIKDDGTFTTTKGAPSPGAPATPVERKATGTIVGSGEFTVTGELKTAEQLKVLNGKTYNNGDLANKCEVPADRSTGQWPLKFFAEGATTTGIDPWTWTYETACEQRVESSSAKPEGNIVGALCPAKVTLAKATCKDATARLTVKNPNSHASLLVGFNDAVAVKVEAGKSIVHAFTSGAVQVRVDGKDAGKPYVFEPAKDCPAPPAPPAPGAGGGNEDDGKPTLPLTGAAAGSIAGTAAVLLGLGFVLFRAARRRRIRFVA